jgi:predicted phage terminase large subunit-like protein
MKIIMSKESSMDDLRKHIINDPKVRREIAKKSHFGFFNIYLASYIKYPTALFQREMFEITQDDSVKAAAIVAFRESAKSTIFSLSYPIWSMVTGKKKFILILSQNQDQCELKLANIRAEFEKNSLLISDFGPFKQIYQTSKWSANALVIDSYDCMIACISTGTKIRGIIYKQYRPDLMIFDDVEDISSTRAKEGRDKTFEWFSSEAVPAGDSSKKLIVVGNKLHEDCLMMRLKKQIEEENFSAEYREYSLLDSYGNCLWPQKFKTGDDIEALRKSVVSSSAWRREYLLEEVYQEDAVVLKDWIKYYDDIPEEAKDLRCIEIGIDLAISLKDCADFTAMIPAKVYHFGQDIKIYILPCIVNERLNYLQTLDRIGELYNYLNMGCPVLINVEETGYQGSVVEALRKQNYPAQGVKVMGMDKRARLALTTPYIQNGNILFPKKGCEQLINQIVRFGYERHDDLVDAFTILITKIIEHNKKPPVVTGEILYGDDDYNFNFNF